MSKLVFLRLSLFLMLILLISSLAGCVEASQDITPTQERPSRTSEPTEPTVQPTSITESTFVPPYDPDARPNLPPPYSVSSDIWGWGSGIPAMPVEGTPQWIDHPEPPRPADDPALFEEAKCGYDPETNSYLDCSFTSPLVVFDCNMIYPPNGLGASLDPAQALVGVCYFEGENGDTPEDGLYRAGCMWVQSIGYIFKIDGEYKLIKTLAEMQALFAPITSPKEALDYAVMISGMDARYDFYGYSDSTVYFADVIEDTSVSEVDGGYIAHLYHSKICSCDTFMTSQVDVIIYEDGSMEWGEAVPVYLEISEGMCVD